MSYREPAEDVEDGTFLHVGSRETCPACHSALTEMRGLHSNEKVWTADEVKPKFCGPSARIKVGWVRRCRLKTEHLHQTCHVCKAKWICATQEVVGESGA